MERDFEFKDIPAGYQLCFNGSCPLHADCLRWVAGQKTPKTVKWGPAVYPTAVEDNGHCGFYKKAEPIRMAWGLNSLLYDVLARDIKGIRIGLQQYLGGRSNYYRYNSGERLLTPEQQQWVRDYFRKCGYTKDREFMGYVLTYNF